MTTTLTAAQAYRKGWDASKRTTTYDLDAAESRFERRYGTGTGTAFAAGWADHASDYEFGHSLSAFSNQSEERTSVTTTPSTTQEPSYTWHPFQEAQAGDEIRTGHGFTRIAAIHFLSSSDSVHIRWENGGTHTAPVHHFATQVRREVTTPEPTTALRRAGYQYLGKAQRTGDHTGPGEWCGAVAVGAVGGCTRTANHKDFHQNGATCDAWLDLTESTPAPVHTLHAHRQVARDKVSGRDVEVLETVAQGGLTVYRVRPLVGITFSYPWVEADRLTFAPQAQLRTGADQ